MSFVARFSAGQVELAFEACEWQPWVQGGDECVSGFLSRATIGFLLARPPRSTMRQGKARFPPFGREP